MKRLFHRIRLMLLFSRQWPLCSRLEPEWTEADAEVLRRYFHTPSGRKLMEIMRHREQGSNSGAVLAPGKRRTFTCGFAAGQRGAFAWFYQLSHVGIESDDNGKPSDGAEDFAQRHTP